MTMTVGGPIVLSIVLLLITWWAILRIGERIVDLWSVFALMGLVILILTILILSRLVGVI